MYMQRIIIGGLLLVSGCALADNANNPFFMPSQRVDIENQGKEMLSVEQCEAKFEKSDEEASLADLLKKEIGADKESDDPKYHPDVLGSWTKADIDSSRFIGDINGFKVYYHPTENVYINLDLSKANKN